MNILQKYEKKFYLILLIGIVTYFPIFFNGFVWDDNSFIINNPQVHQVNIFALFGPNLFNAGLFYRPIPALYFAVIYSLVGNHAFLYHLIQLALHLTDSFLLFLFFCLFFTEDIAFFLALVFLGHPINVESVAYIGATQSELYFLPGIVALLLSRAKDVTRKKLLWITLLLLLSALTKETGFLFIFLIIASRYLFRLGKLKEFILSGGSVVLLYSLLRFFVSGVKLQGSASFISIANLPLSQRLLNIPAIIFYYIKTFVFPSTLTIWQSWTITKVSFQNFFFPLEVCVLLLIISVYFAYTLVKPAAKVSKQNYIQEKFVKLKQFFFFILWFLIGIGLVLQIVPLDMTVSDRWFYFPIVGLLGMIGVALQTFLPSIRRHYKIYVYTAIIIVCLLSARTFMRTFDWKNELTIYADATHAHGNYMLDSAYAARLFNAGKHEVAIKYDERSVVNSPSITNVGLLGAFYKELNQCDNAIPVLEQAITYYKPTVQPLNGLTSMDDYDLKYAYNNLLYCYGQENMPHEAINLITNKVLKKFPTDPSFYTILALSYSEVGDRTQALNAITKARSLSSDPTIIELYNQIKNNTPPSQ